MLVVAGAGLWITTTHSPGRLGSFPDTAAPASSAFDESSRAKHRVVVYYFHRTMRCATCLAIEAYAQTEIEDAFLEPLLDGELEWHAVNLDEPQNRYFEADYELNTNALVVVETRGGQPMRWKNLERIWDLVRDEQAYKHYVQEQVGEFLDRSETAEDCPDAFSQ